MKSSKAFWVGIICAVGGCTQILDLDQDYRPGASSSSSGGNGGSAGMGGSGGNGQCMVDNDCPAATAICTTNKCNGGMCVTTNSPSGSPCSADSMILCDGNGICGECNQPSDCLALPADDECQTRTCDNHVCGQTFAASGTVLQMQTAGDCQLAICDGSGKTTNQIDDADLPEDNKPCTKNICTNGVPSNPNEPANTSCGANLICNDMGECVGCVLPTDCSGTDDFCKTRTCTNGTCGFNFTATGTDLPTGQTAKNCKVLECDGQGNTITSSDDADVPVDGNPCTKDVCTAGVPSNPFEAQGTSCGGTNVCNGAGVCQHQNGTGCLAGADCVSAKCIDGVCCDSTCTQTCKACNVPGLVGTCSNVPLGYADDTCPSPKSCDGSNGASACVSLFPIGYACTAGTQCANGMCVDGVCCASTCTGTCQACNVMGSVGTCTTVPAGQKDTGTCSGTNTCGAMGVCKKDNGQTCAAATDCLTGFCVDGVCCNNSCTTTCKACNVTGSVGTCSNVPSGSTDGATCSGTNACDGNGACKKQLGQTCATPSDCVNGFCIDGVCCNSACLGTCQSCDVTGAVGSCVNVPSGMDDPIATMTCIGNYSCNGSGACLLDNGQPCTMNGECVSNNCTANVCQ